MNEKYIEIPCLEIEQPIGKFYLGIINANDLIRIATADIRRLEDPELDTYLGIQRRLSPRRVAELERYVNLPDATFPSSIVIAVSSNDASFDEEKKLMKIRDDKDVAKIIDGQHRIAGLEKLSSDQRFEIVATIFVEMDVEDQANVFATINLAQTQVNKSLLYDLYEYARTASPHKTAHTIARFLNSKEGSPLRDRIKILGTARPELKQKQTLTQATIVESLLELISGTVERANADRDIMKMGKKPESATENEARILIFRNRFIDGRDVDITRIIWNYLNAIKNRWSEAWNSLEANNILARKNGFRAFMRLLPLIYRRLAKNEEIPTEGEFQAILNMIPFRSFDFSKEEFRHGKEGENELFEALIKALNINQEANVL